MKYLADMIGKIAEAYTASVKWKQATYIDRIEDEIYTLSNNPRGVDELRLKVLVERKRRRKEELKRLSSL